MKNIDNLETIAEYLLENNLSIRETGKHFNMAKSSVHYYLNKKLKYDNYDLYKLIKKLLQDHFNNKHIKGGMATKKKYEQIKLSNFYSNKIIDSTNNLN